MYRKDGGVKKWPNRWKVNSRKNFPEVEARREMGADFVADGTAGRGKLG